MTPARRLLAVGVAVLALATAYALLRVQSWFEER